MTDGFVLPVENIESDSTAKVSCKYPRRGGFGTRDGMVFYYMRDGDKVVTLNLRGHRYSYCRNNPHKYTDPDGRIGMLAAWALGTVAFTIVHVIKTVMEYENNRNPLMTDSYH